MNFKNLVDASVRSVRNQCPPKAFRDQDLYCYWLSQTYYFVRHSTPLLGFALPHLKDEKLRHIFEHHLGEESRHDLLALKDLEKMKQTLSDYPESTWTQAFYQGQYYRIQFEGGTSLLGYILFLEAMAVTLGKEMYQETMSLYPGAGLFLKVHAEEDISHVARAISIIETLPEEEQEKIAQNLRSSEVIYSAILKEGMRNLQKKVA